MLKYKKYFFVCFVICVFAYSVQIVNGCTNVWDGLWVGSYHVGYKWCIQIGRWFWPFISVGRLSIAAEPFTSLLTVALYVLSGCLILSLFDLRDAKAAYLALLSLGINTVVCISLSYRFMSPTFGCSVLLSVLSIWIMSRKTGWWAWALAAAALTLALGAYQASVGCAAVLFLAQVMALLLRQKPWKEILSFVLRTLAVFLAACILYKLLWDFSLSILHLEAAAYRGADRLTISHLLTGLPRRIADAYQEFFRYFTGRSFLHNIYQHLVLYRAAAAAFALFSLLPAVKCFRAGKGRAALVLLCLLALPLAANVCLLMAPDAGGMDIQMSFSLAMIGPVLLCVYCQPEAAGGMAKGNRPEKRGFLFYLTQYGPLALISLILAGSFLQVSVDQHTMLHGRETTLAFMNRVTASLEAKNLIPTENEIVFLGRPADNPLFKKDELWDLSNDRARYGDLPISNDNSVASYSGVLRDGGFDLPLVSDGSLWHEIENKPESRALPVYPAEGFCQVIDRYLVVKVSE